MSSPDDSALLHAAPYNPQLAREYYLRTRKLKGRQVGVKQTPTSRVKDNTNPSVKRIARPPRLTSKQRQAAVNERVSVFRHRLKRLHDVLNTLLSKAKANDEKKKKKDSPANKDTNKTASDRKSLTSTQKKEAAVRSKEHYEKNKDTDTSSDKDVKGEIKEVREKIRKIRIQLKDAIEKARLQSSKSKTVKGR